LEVRVLPEAFASNSLTNAYFAMSAVIRAGQALTEKERALISQSTKAALKTGKACGVSLAVKALPQLANLPSLPYHHGLLRHLLHQ
jgi:hypothetical protein